ncbi:MAG: sulfite reductase subunit alpha [Alphaproteobacteria bacterium]
MNARSSVWSAQPVVAALVAGPLLLWLIVRAAGPDAVALRPGSAPLISALIVILTYLAFCGLTYRAYRQRRDGAARESAGLLRTEGASGPPILIAYATQTGFAEDLAWRTARSLQAAHVPAKVVPLAQLDVATLAAARRALFIVSTTGEGDMPDGAAGFVRRVMPKPVHLSDLHYGVLALGDRTYTSYCAFGHALDGWLRGQRATPLFDLVEVDDGDEGALLHWQSNLRMIGGGTEVPDWAPPSYGRWRLVERRLLNPGSPGGPAFHLAFEPVESMPTWHAGDIAEIGPRNDPAEVARLLAMSEIDGQEKVKGREETWREFLARSVLPHDDVAIRAFMSLSAEERSNSLRALPHREYSVASLPVDGRLELLVREMRHPDGRLGLGSGWLTAHVPVGGAVALRVRENRGFHAPEDGRPMILIGNGTGLAGLRTHVKARVSAGHTRNWLVFGERTQAHDYFHRAEIEAWHASGVLERLDLAFSRDQVARVYVQDKLRAAADELRAWVDEGAAIYVCGSLEGMAPGVAAALAEVLGADMLERLADEGRYRRDVY